MAATAYHVGLLTVSGERLLHAYLVTRISTACGDTHG